MSDLRLRPEDGLRIARQVAREAAAPLRDAVGKPAEIRSKSNSRDLVTEWDTRTEALIRARLRALTPDIPLLGEEGGITAPDADVPAAASTDRWLVDPIDGTVNFAHGSPHFSIVIALERDGQPIVGVVLAPVLDWEFYGHIGGGAFMNGKRLSVSGIDTLDGAMLASGFPYDRADNPDNNFDMWERFQRRAGACRRFGTASLDLCMVACNWFDGYWENRLKPWDLSAGVLLVREAGGQVTAYDGSEFISDRGEVVASNGAIHEAMLVEIEDVVKARQDPALED